MHGMSLGPADLAASRAMKTTRVGGGHPDYAVLSDAKGEAARENSSRTSGTTPSARWSTPARRPASKLLRPVWRLLRSRRLRGQFRNAFLMGCVGAWSLHPSQVPIAKRVFSPDPGEVAFARKILAAMPDGTGAVMIDGKMQDDATWKQAKVWTIWRGWWRPRTRRWRGGTAGEPRPDTLAPATIRVICKP